MNSAPHIDPIRTALYRANGHWRDKTLLEWFDAAVSRRPDKVAIVAPGGRRISYSELKASSDAVAAGLHVLGLGKDSVVSVQLPNWSEFVIIHLAATRIGAITNPLLPNYREKELHHILSVAKSAAVVIPSRFRNFDYVEMYRGLVGGLPDLKAVYVVGDHKDESMKSFSDLLQPSRPALEPVQMLGDDITAMIFTSGTEATPKGVIHSHNTTMYGTLTLAELLGIRHDDVIWAPSPLGHGTGFEWGMRLALTVGATLVLQDIWHPDVAVELIEHEKISFTMTATAFVNMLMQSDELSKRDVGSLRIFACAGAPIPQQLGEAVKQRFGCSLIGMWGMTECFVATASSPADSESKHWHTDGKALPGAEIAIFDEQRQKRLAPGEVGELATRGPHVCLGYFNDPKRTADSFTADGWLFSGDLAVMDADGYVRIVGRKKDIINRGGLKISAREVEELLELNPSVQQAAVVGVPDDKLGEIACAFLVPKSGCKPQFDELIAELERKGLAKYKLPERMVLVEDLPMTASGKIQKFMLRQSYVDSVAPGRKS